MSAMAESRIRRKFLRRWTEVIFLGRTEDSALLGNACSMLLFNVIGWMLALSVGGGDFMVSSINAFKIVRSLKIRGLRNLRPSL
jgi:hypothetical protein